jgi:hypothetical protein
LLGGGLVGLALAVAAIWVFYRGKDRVLAGEQDAAVPDAALIRALGPDTGVAAPDDGGIDDAPVDSPHVDAAAMRDASVAIRADAAAINRRADAGTSTKPDAAPTTESRGTATLQIGADPWGEIVVDGRAMGRTPRELVVPTGRHTIEIVFPAENPPRTQTFAVDLGAGETKPIQADFTK